MAESRGDEWLDGGRGEEALEEVREDGVGECGLRSTAGAAGKEGDGEAAVWSGEEGWYGAVERFGRGVGGDGGEGGKGDDGVEGGVSGTEGEGLGGGPRGRVEQGGGEDVVGGEDGQCVGNGGEKGRCGESGGVGDVDAAEFLALVRLKPSK